MKLLAVFLCSYCALAQLPHSTAIEPNVDAQQIPEDRGAVALWQSLKKLHTRASLIMITAHPDDEDGGMLTYESRGEGSRVTLLTLNRGEGGANLMSPDYFDALGLVRTEELLAADRYYGVDQYWTRVVDYGFSKTKAESISRWTHDRVFYDVVRVVRMVRPLVITSVFVGAESDGHGNHQTAGVMAQEVFKAAGDPNVFPDQIKAGLRPWTPVKVYARTPFRQRNDFSLAPNIEIPEGNYDPLLGASYVQISRVGLCFQKSQNGGSYIPAAGPFSSSYHRFGSNIEVSEKEHSFFDGIDTSLEGISEFAGAEKPPFLTSGLQKIASAVEEALAQFSAVDPARCAPALANGAKATLALISEVDKSSLPDEAKYNIQHELNLKSVQFNSALSESLGLWLSANVTPAIEPNPLYAMFMGDPETFTAAVPGQSFDVKVHVVNQTATPLMLTNARVESYQQKESWAVSAIKPVNTEELVKNKAADFRFHVKVPEDADYTRPYFVRPNIEQSYYDITDEASLNRPLPPYPLAAWAEFSYQGVPIQIGEYVQTVQRLTGEGTVLRPLGVAPAIGVAISPRAGIVPLNQKTFPVSVVIHSNSVGTKKGNVRLTLPSGWHSDPAVAEFAPSEAGQDQSLTFQVKCGDLRPQSYQISAIAEYAGRQYKEGYVTVGYPGLRPYSLYTPATYNFSGVDVKTASGLKVGYVMGSGDDVPSSLEHLGVRARLLGPTDIATGNLGDYDVILLGVRTYAARSDLHTYNSRLLDYVRNGGVLIVQYNTPEFDQNFGPYPYSMTSEPEEVTDENSTVEILEPSNPVFNWPNKISAADFSGWVEERGSKWMKSWNPRYEALLETHDEGQAPQKGGLLYAKYGKGIYIYNAYAFYRELPEGVPGAYRLMANMISLAKNDHR